MIIKTRVYTEEERELQLPAYFKYDKTFYKYYLNSEGNERCDQVRHEGHYFYVYVDSYVSSNREGFERGTAITKEQYDEAVLKFQERASSLAKSSTEKLQTA